MAGMNFVLPMTKDDLLSSNSPDDRYSVEEVCNEKDVYKKLHGVTRVFESTDPGADFIFSHFDGFFSAVFHFHKIDDSARRRSWHLLFRVCMQFKDLLVNALKSSTLDEEVRSTYCNALKMLMYLLTQHVVYFENVLDKKNSKEEKKLSKPKGASGAKKRKTSVQEPMGGCLEFNWEQQSMEAMVLIHHIMLLPVQKLWATPLVEEQFVNLVGNCCYKLLDDPDIHLVKMKPMRDLVFDILGLLISNHFHTPTFIMTLVKLLTSTDHLSGALAKGVVVLVQKYHQQGLVRSIINEIIHHGVAEFSKENSGAAKAYSEFLVSLAEGDPAIMMSSIKILLPLLDKDPYQLRNCVLSVFAEVLVQDLRQPTGNQNEEERLELREEIYENLEEHFHDSNAFVRSKVCQIWLRLFEAEAVPLSRHQQLLELAVGRLHDKSLHVRKFALQVITAFLEKHQFVAQTGVEAVQVLLKDQRARLHKMEVRSRVLQLDEDSAQFWSELDEELSQLILTKLQENNGAFEGEQLFAVAGITEAVWNCQVNALKKDLSQAFDQLRSCEDQTASEHSTVGLPLLERVCLYKLLMKRILFTPQVAEADSQKLTDSQMQDAALVNPFTYINVAEKDLLKARELVTFFHASVKVGQLLNAAVPHIRDLLSSSVTSDVLQAVDFFTAAHPYKLVDVTGCIQDMLSLVWSQDQAIKATVAEAYKTIYLAPHIDKYKERAVAAIDNLTRLLQAPLALHQKAALNKLVVSWMEKEYIDHACLLLLWSRYNMADGTTAEDSLAAAMLLAMVGRCEKQWNMLKNNIDTMVKVGFGERGANDFRLVFYTCQILTSLSPNKPTADIPFVRLRKDHPMFTSLSSILVNGITNMDDSQYLPMATEAFNLIFKLSSNPDQTCEQILKSLLEVLHKEKEAVPNGAEACNGDEDVPLSGMDRRKRSLPIVLARLLHCVGHGALLLFHYIDKDVYVEMKRREAATMEETNRKREEAKRVAKRRSASHISIRPSNVTEAGSDDDLEGAVAEDEDAEMIRSLCDKQLLAPTRLLGVLSRLVEYVVTHTDIYQNADLQASATLALGKLMAVSPSFCTKKLECLVAFAMQSPNLTIRSNGVLIMRDLTFRFPTMLEPETKHLYARLRDESRQVRGNAMTALSSLILTEMVKAKSNISQLSRCIVDEDEDMVQRAKELFKMMSQKGNQLYNALPDIISKLSNPQEEVQEDDFHSIMKYIMSLVHKDRQHELLVEKLCARFRLSESERQWRDLAFCLSLLTYNERSIRKLLDNLSLYADKLQHEPVYEHLVAIVDQAGKQGKPEMKLLIEELGQRIENCKEKGMDDGCYTQSVKVPPKPTKKPEKNKENAQQKRDRKSRRTRAASTSASEDESMSDESDDEEAKTTAKTPAKRAAKTPAKRPAKTPARRTSKTPAQRKTRQTVGRKRKESTSEESSED